MHQQVLHIQRNSCWSTERIINPCIPHHPFTFSPATFRHPSVKKNPAFGERNLISIGQLCDHGLSALFTTKDVSLIIPTSTLTGISNTNNRLYCVNLQSANQSPVSPIPPHSLFSNNVHALSTKSDIVQYLHRLAFSPVVLTWTAAITSGFFTTWPGLTSALVRKHLPKSLATTKGHLRQDRQNHFSRHSHLRSACYDDPSPSFAGI